MNAETVGLLSLICIGIAVVAAVVIIGLVALFVVEGLIRGVEWVMAAVKRGEA